MTSRGISLFSLGRSVWTDVRGAWRYLVLFQLGFKLFEAWLLVPAIAVLLSAVLRRAGHFAVSNQDILNFLLSPLGLVYGMLFSTIAVSLFLLEQAGMMAIVSVSEGHNRPTWKQILGSTLFFVVHVTKLGFLKAMLLAISLLPFLFIAILTYSLLLTQHDIYFYWKERPTEFWQAVAVGLLLVVIATCGGLWLGVRWIFALPILLFESERTQGVLRTSRDRVRGIAWPLGKVLVIWLAGTAFMGGILGASFRQIAAAALSTTGEFPIVAIVALLILQTGLLAGWSFASSVGLALLLRRLYLAHGISAANPPRQIVNRVAEIEQTTKQGSWRFALVALTILGLAPLAVWAELPRYLDDPPSVKITAHRGHARAAPENTLSAIQKAITSRADYAEIDVQLTADGVIVLLHDRDLKRVAGDPRALAELTFDELRVLDVGSWFGEAFRGERVPTLTEAMELSRGKMKLNIELKFYGPDRQLAGEVARLVREADFESECIVTSLNYDACVEAKRHNPQLRTGLIVAHAIGNIGRLEVDALSVRADFLSSAILRAARRAKREVHVWTVNRPRQMAELMKRGVDNILTSDPDLGVQVRDEWQALIPPERLLLSARLLLGLPLQNHGP